MCNLHTSCSSCDGRFTVDGGMERAVVAADAHHADCHGTVTVAEVRDSWWGPVPADPANMPTVDDLVAAVVAAEASYCRTHGVRADEHVGGCAS